MPAALRLRGGRQQAAHRLQLPGQAQLAVELTRLGDFPRRAPRRCGDLPRGEQDPERDRQIEAAAFLRQLRGREIDGDAAGGKLEAASSAAPRARAPSLSRTTVAGKADDAESRQPGSQDSPRRAPAARSSPTCARQATRANATGAPRELPVAQPGGPGSRGPGRSARGPRHLPAPRGFASSASSRARVRSSTRAWASNSSRVTRSSLAQRSRSTARKLFSRSSCMLRSAGGTRSSRRRAISSMRNGP